MAGKSENIDPGLIARLTQGVRFIVGGTRPDAWFGPATPITPVAQAPSDQVVGRQFDYPVGFNTRTKPRGEEAVSFADMRAVADAYDLLRIVIETRKDQISKLNFVVRHEDKKTKPDARCKEVAAFLKSPDKRNSWNDWLRLVLEDLFVIDAPAIYPRLTVGGKLYALEAMDGAMLKRVLDATGRTPTAPDPAYQQVLKGLPAVDYSADELIYRPRNQRTHKVYGFSPVEQIITTINIGLRRQAAQVEYFTSGSIPDGMLAVPEEWTPEQIKGFQTYWDSVLSGNAGERSKMRMVPGKSAYIATKEAVLKGEFDEWLARVVCYCFGVAHSAFVKEPNKATAGTAQDVAVAEGLQPLMQWVADLMNSIIWKYFGYTDLVFDWEEDEAINPLDQATILTTYVNAGIMDVNEARAVIGLEAKSDDEIAAMKPTPPMGFSGAKDPSDSKKPDADDADSKAEKIAKAMGGLHIHMPEIRSPDVIVDIAPVVVNVGRPE